MQTWEFLSELSSKLSQLRTETRITSTIAHKIQMTNSREKPLLLYLSTSKAKKDHE